MRLVEDILDITPGKSATTRRQARPTDWFFDGHFPGDPVVPAIALVELLAQTGGLAAGALRQGVMPRPHQMRLAALGPFKFPAAAGPGATLEATARVVRGIGGLYRVEGEVRADGTVVAIGSLTLAEARP